jgi:low affinity Fe/Cu permease
MAVVTERSGNKTAWILVALIAIVAIVALAFVFINNENTRELQAQRDAQSQIMAANDAAQRTLGDAADASARAAAAAADRAEDAAAATAGAITGAADATVDAGREAASDVDAAVTVPPGGSVSTTTRTQTTRTQ